ncbi:MAG: efflux RND transporter periplasmic adaptor subunit [Chitinophagaceae bacterium]|nr:efflux RND transporter periplasmic adaptor subunit [Chitinophagaceae bacterium]
MNFKYYLLLWISYTTISCTSNQKSIEKNAESLAEITTANQVRLSAKQAQNAGIETGMVEEKEIFTVTGASGVLEVPPHNIVSISVPMGGFLRKMLLLPGTRVKKGDVLATLEDQQFIQLQEDYLLAKSKLQVLDADFNRQQKLNAAKATSDKIFQQVSGDFERQKIMVRALSEKLRLICLDPDGVNENNISRSIVIHSPINGFVTSVNANSGKYMHPADVICELVNPRDLHLSLKVFDHDAVRVAKGQKVTFYGNSDTTRKFVARVDLINPNIDGERTMEVHCDIENYDQSMLPGTFVNAEIQLKNTVVNVLPDDAIVRWENRPYVFVEEDELLYKMVPVDIGASSLGYSEIKSDIQGRKIVVKNAYTLLMALKNSSEEG